MFSSTDSHLLVDGLAGLLKRFSFCLCLEGPGGQMAAKDSILESESVALKEPWGSCPVCPETSN